MNEEAIIVNAKDFWNGRLAVPSYEVRRCNLLNRPLKIVHKNADGDKIHELFIPIEKLDKYERTGIYNYLDKTSSSKYELLNYEIEQFKTEGTNDRPRSRMPESSQRARTSG